MNSNQVMSRAQNGCRGGSRGTKEPLLIDAVIGKVVKRNRRNLSAAWIDYKKAFDSVPHTWLKRVLELYKVDGTVRDFLGQCMGQWSTILCHLGERMTAAENHIRIRRGIFQGDCLSPTWYCLSLNPLSTLLEGSGRRFQLRRGGTKVTHLFNMDDLKLFASSHSHLKELLNITCDFSNSIRMELGTDKCAILHVERGRVANSEGIDLSMPISIRTLSEAETYRYLGMSQNIGVDESGMKRIGADTEVKRGRPSTSSLENEIQAKRKRGPAVVALPKDIRKDGVDHWPQVGGSLRCKYPQCKGNSTIRCSKCGINLCLNKNNNCFENYHKD
ncbi:unnamed protein product [Parnassius mnemosyne]|uniref:Reverse transcriptase domain-containing protein n=1 Tax=Parnassius mnemosyne TaxID=213953 RepID=A0AAV1L7D3_9NEOP